MFSIEELGRICGVKVEYIEKIIADGYLEENSSLKASNFVLSELSNERLMTFIMEYLTVGSL